MRDYTDNMCWIKNTYYIPMDEVIPNKDEDIETEINYYQWVPIVLIVQALLFYLPYMVSTLDFLQLQNSVYRVRESAA